jgi:NADH-quinone oxidoreductase subunit K
MFESVGLHHYLVVGLILFGFGLFCVLTRRNAIGVLMGVELILNAWPSC